MARCTLLLVALLLAGCATTYSAPPDSYFRCDRNGEREQRMAC